MIKTLSSLSALMLGLTVSTTPAQAQDYSHTVTSGASPGMCLGVQETNLRHPFMAACNASFAAERWMVGPPNANGFVKLHSQRTGADTCLGVAAADTSTLVMAACDSVKNQQWMMAPGPQPGTYMMTSQLLGPGVCLGIRPNTGGAELDMNACRGFPGQTWSVSGM